jgi:N-acetylglucosaminyldiphosphoundecaprenol N-acetyl-beta-D-mannosaminyltransferase
MEENLWKNLNIDPLGKCIDDIMLTIQIFSKCRTILCLNPHSWVEAEKDNKFRDALVNADWLLADGVGVSIASGFFKSPSSPRIPGPDLYLKLMHRLNEQGGKVFFLGSTKETLSKIKDKIETDFKNLKIAGIYSPPFEAQFTDQENKKMIEIINKSSPDILWVGMTAPKQEKWILENQSKLKVPVVAGIGAAFDFYAGTVKRAPRFVRRLGLEWAYRFIGSPRRLLKRNLVSTPKFIYRIIIHKFLIKKFLNYNNE